MVNTIEPLSDLVAPEVVTPEAMAGALASAPAPIPSGVWENLSPSDCLLLQLAAKLAPDDTSAVDTIIATAYLANLDAGTIRLRSLQEKWCFGLLTRTVLRVVPTGGGSTWHRGSLEATICESGSIAEAIYHWLGEDSRDPRAEALRIMRKRLVYRGLLDEEVRTHRVLWLFNVSTYTYRPLVLPPEPVELVKGFRKTDPDLHLQLMAEIATGFNRRTIVDSYD